MKKKLWGEARKKQDQMDMDNQIKILDMKKERVIALNATDAVNLRRDITQRGVMSRSRVLGLTDSTSQTKRHE